MFGTYRRMLYRLMDFNNDGQALRMSAFQLKCNLDAARRAMDRVLKSGEAPEIFRHEFAESRNDKWISTAVKCRTDSVVSRNSSPK